MFKNLQVIVTEKSKNISKTPTKKKIGERSIEVVSLINVNLVYLTAFQEITGKREEKIEVGEGSKLKDLLESLSQRYGKKFGETLFDPKGKVHDYNHITLNGQLAHLLDENFEIKLSDGDRVVIAHAVSGGC
jgi:MoaD family protein